MPDFFHKLRNAKDLFKVIADEKKLNPFVVEKDYWVMHCIWGLTQKKIEFEMKGGTSLFKGWGIINRFSEDIDIRFEAPKNLKEKNPKPKHVEGRRKFFDELAEIIRIPDIFVERYKPADDEKLKNAGISLKYKTYFEPVPGVRPFVLLEAGFERTAPNEPKLVTSWVMERALKLNMKILDNRAREVRMFLPKYTFVDKIQTVCNKYRKYREDPIKNRPREFLRHYYDLYMLLGENTVKEFIGTPKYKEYLKEKLKPADKVEFDRKEALTIPIGAVYDDFKSEFASMKTLLLSSGPTFDEVRNRISEYAKDF